MKKGKQFSTPLDKVLQTNFMNSAENYRHILFT